MRWTTKYIENKLNRINELEEAIQRVRELHKPFNFEEEVWCLHCGNCKDGQQLYPCLTIKALDGEQ